MYAVINAGGKQERVEVGELVDVELLDVAPGDELTLTPLLVVDGAEVTVSAEALAGQCVTATVVGEVKGPKIVGFTYKSKTRQRRHYGHRQRYTTLEITGIGASASTAAASKAAGSSKTADVAKTAAAKTPGAAKTAAAKTSAASKVAGASKTTAAKAAAAADQSDAGDAAVTTEQD